MTTLPLVRTDVPKENERQHRTTLATTINELIQLLDEYPLKAGDETITGEWTVTGELTFTRDDNWAFIVESTTPVSLWVDTSAPATNTGKWAMGSNAGEFFVLAYNDALNAYRAPWVAARTTDYNVDFVEYNATSHRFSLNDRTTRLATIDVRSSIHTLAMEAPGTTGSVVIGFYENDGTTRKGHVGYGASGNNFLYLWQEEADVLAVISGGDIFVQTTAGGNINMAQGATTVGRFDNNSTAGNTRFLVYDVDNATLERVSVGAADSGGTGFKVLRIPN
jgi:hypothetical protein